MHFRTDDLEETLQEQVCCRTTAERSKPPRRSSPRFDKRANRSSGSQGGIHRRGTRRATS
jgi:hypothetical protein